jgi:hypothetical protein
MATGGGDEAVAQRIIRLTDIVQEPLRFLTPIGGYEKMPLVSLEKALEPLVPILPTVQSHAYVAKQLCQNPADGLSQECLYIALNNTLRSVTNRQQKLKPWYLYLRLFLNALFRLPPLCEIAFRGIKLDMSKNYATGQTIIWWGFSSCTTAVEVLQSDQFLGKTAVRTMFNIQSETARDIRKHSYYPAEDEVLLLAATQFKVAGCLDQGNLRIVHLKETQPPYPLLMQPVPIIYQTINPSPAPAPSK